MNFNNQGYNKQELTKAMDCYMVGRLAVDERIFPGGEEDEPVTLMRNSDTVMFFIKPLSAEPEPIKNYYKHENGNMYIGIEHDQSNAILNDPTYSYKLFSERVDDWRKRLEGKLVLFKPNIKFPRNGTPFLNLRLISIEGDIEPDTKEIFTCIPKINLDPATFEMKLRNGSYISFEEYYHYLPNPSYVICGDYLYFNFKNWSKHSENLKMWRIESEAEQILRVPLNFNENEFNNYVVTGTRYLEFISEIGAMTLSNILPAMGQSILSGNEAMMFETTLNPVLPANLVSSIKTVPQKMKATTPNLVSTMVDGERMFLNELYQLARREGLNYDIRDLINFHVSVKTNPLTIVAGISGMGKTELSCLYAQVLGLSEADGNHLFMPITPGYTEPDDVLGYLNVDTGYYVPASNGLVDMLIQAEQNPDQLYMISFDEMNLSQIEYWFAPFLSLLELKPERRRLQLYGKGSFCRNRDRYKDHVMIGDNVIFVGTVNLDETCKEFSDRLLDRVNVVTLQKESFRALKLSTPSTEEGEKNFTFNQFKGWLNTNSGMEVFTLEELDFFDELHQLINRYDAQKGVSYRLLNKIGCYINNLPTGEVNGVTLTRSEAIDLGMKQRLLTKIKGGESQIGSLVGVVMDPDDELTNSKLATLFQSETAQKISTFEQTINEIKRKALELGIYGQTN